MCEAGTAPQLSFTRCPPAFQQTRQTLVSPLLRPSRRLVASPRLAIPPLPARPQRWTLALRFRAAWHSATGMGALGGCEQRL
jgi:hypothetical protein